VVGGSDEEGVEWIVYSGFEGFGMEYVCPVDEFEPEEPPGMADGLEAFADGFFPPPFEDSPGWFVSEAIYADDDFGHYYSPMENLQKSEYSFVFDMILFTSS